MAGTSQARDGRMSLSFLLKVDKTEKSTALAVGDIVIIKAKASTGTIFGDIPVNNVFIANKALTPGTGDKYYSCTAMFLGQATGKTVSESKNITDVTIDYDAKTNNVSDGVVTKSGSISGALITESLSITNSGVNELKKRFDSIAEVATDGSVTYGEANTTKKDLLMICWNGRNAETGDLLEFEIIPALFSNLSKGGQYNSSQNFDVDFSGNDSDDDGFMGEVIQVRNATGLLPSIVRPTV